MGSEQMELMETIPDETDGKDEFGFNSSLADLQLTLSRSFHSHSPTDSFLICLLQHISGKYDEYALDKLYMHLDIPTDYQQKITEILEGENTPINHPNHSKSKSEATKRFNNSSSKTGIQSELVQYLNKLLNSNLRLFYIKLPSDLTTLTQNLKNGRGFNDESVYLGMTFDLNEGTPKVKQYRLIIHKRLLFEDEDSYVQDLVYRFAKNDVCLKEALRTNIDSMNAEDVNKFWTDKVRSISEMTVSDIYNLEDPNGCSQGSGSFCQNCLSLKQIQYYETGDLSQIIFHYLRTYFIECLNWIVREKIESTLALFCQQKASLGLIGQNTMSKIIELELQLEEEVNEDQQCVIDKRITWLKLIQMVLDFKPDYEFLRQTNMRELRAKTITDQEYNTNPKELLNSLGLGNYFSTTILEPYDRHDSIFEPSEVADLGKAIRIILKDYTWDVPVPSNNNIIQFMVRDLVLSKAVSELNSIHDEVSPMEIRFLVSEVLYLDVDLTQHLFHGKNIVIVCDTLVFKKNILINTSGHDGSPAQPLKNEPFLDFGRHGEPGTPGNPGGHGGNVWIKCRLIDNPSNYKLTIISSGGKGSNGLDGQDGVQGKPGRDGVDGNSVQPSSKPGYNVESGTEGTRGQDGGKGGDRGIGGAKGLKGVVYLEGLTDSELVKIPSEDGKDGSAGNHGKGSDGGLGGHDGVDSWYFWEPPETLPGLQRFFFSKGDWKKQKGKLELIPLRGRFTKELFGYYSQVLRTEAEIKATRKDPGKTAETKSNHQNNTNKVMQTNGRTKIARNDILMAWMEFKVQGVGNQTMVISGGLPQGNSRNDASTPMESISRPGYHLARQDTEESLLLKLYHKAKASYTDFKVNTYKPATLNHNRLSVVQSVSKSTTLRFLPFRKIFTSTIKNGSSALLALVNEKIKTLDDPEKSLVLDKIYMSLFKLNNPTTCPEFLEVMFKNCPFVPESTSMSFEYWYITSGLLDTDINVLIKSRQSLFGNQLKVLWEAFNAKVHSTSKFMVFLRQLSDLPKCQHTHEILSQNQNNVTKEVYKYVEESIWDRYLYSQVQMSIGPENYHKIPEVIGILKEMLVDYNTFINPAFSLKHFCGQFLNGISRTEGYDPDSFSVAFISLLLFIKIPERTEDVTAYVQTKALEPLDFTRTPEICFVIPFLGLDGVQLDQLKSDILDLPRELNLNRDSPNVMAIFQKIHDTYLLRLQAKKMQNIRKFVSKTEEKYLDDLENFIENELINLPYQTRLSHYDFILERLQNQDHEFLGIRNAYEELLIKIFRGEPDDQQQDDQNPLQIKLPNIEDILNKIQEEETIERLQATIGLINPVLSLSKGQDFVINNEVDSERQLTKVSHIMTLLRNTMDLTEPNISQKTVVRVYKHILETLVTKSKQNLQAKLKKPYGFPTWFDDTYKNEMIKLAEIDTELRLRQSLLEFINYGHMNSTHLKERLSNIMEFARKASSGDLTLTQKVSSVLEKLTALAQAMIYNEESGLWNRTQTLQVSSRLTEAVRYYQLQYHTGRNMNETLEFVHILLKEFNEFLASEIPINPDFVNLLESLLDNSKKNLLISWISELSSVHEVLNFDEMAVCRQSNARRIVQTKCEKVLKYLVSLDYKVKLPSGYLQLEITLEELETTLKLTRKSTAFEKLEFTETIQKRQIEQKILTSETIFSNLSRFLILYVDYELETESDWSETHSNAIALVQAFRANLAFLNEDELVKNLFSGPLIIPDLLRDPKNSTNIQPHTPVFTVDLNIFYLSLELQRKSINIQDLLLLKNKVVGIFETLITFEQKSTVLKTYENAVFRLLCNQFLNSSYGKRLYLTWTTHTSTTAHEEIITRKKCEEYLQGLIDVVSNCKLATFDTKSINTISNLTNVISVLSPEACMDIQLLLSTFENVPNSRLQIQSQLTQNLNKCTGIYNFEQIIWDTFVSLAYKYSFPVLELVKSTSRFELTDSDDQVLKAFIKNPCATEPNLNKSDELKYIIAVVKLGKDAIYKFLSTGNGNKVSSIDPQKLSLLKFMVERLYVEQLSFKEVTLILKVLLKDLNDSIANYKVSLGPSRTSEWVAKMLEAVHEKYVETKEPCLIHVYQDELEDFIELVRTLDRPLFSQNIFIQMTTILLTELDLFDKKLAFPPKRFKTILSLLKQLLKQKEANEDSVLEALITGLQNCPITHWNVVTENLILMHKWKIDATVASSILRLKSKYTDELLNKFIKSFDDVITISGNEPLLMTILQSLFSGDIHLSESICKELVDLKLVNENKWNSKSSQKKDYKVMSVLKTQRGVTNSLSSTTLELKDVVQMLRADTKNQSIMYMLNPSEGSTVSSLEDRFNKLKEEIGILEDWSTENIESWLCATFGQRLNFNQAEYVEANLEKTLAIINKGCQLSLNKPLRTTQLLTALIFTEAIVIRRKSRLGEIPTGEGKSLVSAVVSILSVFWGEDVDIITSSAVLATETLDQVKALYTLFKIPVGNNCAPEMRSSLNQRKKQYKRCKIIYGDLPSFQQDFLLSNYQNMDITCGRVPGLIIVDEVDSMLLDKAENIFYLAHVIPDLALLRNIYVQIWLGVQVLKADPEITRDEILSKIQSDIKEKVISNYLVVPTYLSDFLNTEIPSWIKNAMDSLELRKDDTYVLANKDHKRRKVMVMDKSTGVEEPEMMWAKVMHQFLQLNHGEKLAMTSIKADFISHLCYFMHFKNKIIGMTGTLGSPGERELLGISYSLEFFSMPRYRYRNCQMIEPVIVSTVEDHVVKLVVEIEKVIGNERSVLAICDNVEFVHHLCSLLTQKYIREGDDIVTIVSYTSSFQTELLQDVLKFLKCRFVIIATNIAGRGTDIVLSHELKANGGLHTILTYVPSSSRLDDQGFGRSSRLDDPGTIQYVIMDENAENQVRSIEEIKSERDLRDSTLLNKYRIHGLQELKFEEALFQQFVQLRSVYKERLEAEVKDTELVSMQMEFFKNRWALWLESNGEGIKDMSSLHCIKSIQDSFEEFKSVVETLLFKCNGESQNQSSNSIFRLARGPFELVRLGLYFQKVKNNKSAINCFQRVIDQNPLLAEMAYYHKAKLILQVMNNSIESRRNAIKNFKAARRLFRIRVADCLSAEKAIDLCYNFKKKKGKGAPSSRIRLQLKNEADLWKELLYSVNDLVGFPLTSAFISNISGDLELRVVNDTDGNENLDFQEAVEPAEVQIKEAQVLLEPDEAPIMEPRTIMVPVGQITQDDAEIIFETLVNGLKNCLSIADQGVLKPIRLCKKVFVTSLDELRIPSVNSNANTEEPEWPLGISYLKPEMIRILKSLDISQENNRTFDSFHLEKFFMTKSILWNRLKSLKGMIFRSDEEITVQIISLPTGDLMTRSKFDELIRDLCPEVLKALPSILKLLITQNGRSLSPETNFTSLHLTPSGIRNLMEKLTTVGYLVKKQTLKALYINDEILWNEVRGQFDGIPESLEPFRDIITDWLGKKDHLMDQLAISDSESGSKVELLTFLLEQRIFKKATFKVPLQSTRNFEKVVKKFVQHDLKLIEMRSKYFKSHEAFVTQLVQKLILSCGSLVTHPKLEINEICLHDLVDHTFYDELTSFGICGITHIVEYNKWTRWYPDTIFVNLFSWPYCALIPPALMFFLPASWVIVPMSILVVVLRFLGHELDLISQEGYWKDADFKFKHRMEFGQVLMKEVALKQICKFLRSSSRSLSTNNSRKIKSIVKSFFNLSGKAVGIVLWIWAICEIFEEILKLEESQNLAVLLIQKGIMSQYKKILIKSEEMKELWAVIQTSNIRSEEYVMNFYNLAKDDLRMQDDTKQFISAAREAMDLGLNNLGRVWASTVGKVLILNGSNPNASGNSGFLENVKYDLSESMKRGKMSLVIQQFNIFGIAILRKMKTLMLAQAELVVPGEEMYPKMARPEVNMKALKKSLELKIVADLEKPIYDLLSSSTQETTVQGVVQNIHRTTVEVVTQIIHQGPTP